MFSFYTYLPSIQIIFLIFEIFVSILQFNLLIAMMTRTYETIFETKKEWNRQVCPAPSTNNSGPLQGAPCFSGLK